MLLSTALAGCTEDESSGGLQPYEDEWREEILTAFPYLDEAGEPQITSITIGGLPVGDNFANRGDVIVQFDPTASLDDGSTWGIRVEMRRFTMASSRAAADLDFDGLKLQASTGSASLTPSPESLCNDEWKDGCSLRVYFEGNTQLSRSGADLRVTLPGFYRHDVFITTQDNTADSDYSRRSDVCIDGLNASAEVELDSGRAFVIMSPQATPMPACELIDGALEDCLEHPDGAWSRDCECIRQLGRFGTLQVESSDGNAASINVDMPQGLWSAVTMINEQSGQIPGTVPPCGEDTSEPGVRCDACIQVADFELAPGNGTEESRDPWRHSGFVAIPSDVAQPGSGYNISGTSKQCSAVSFTPSPDAFVGVGNGASQPTEERGNLSVCNDCLRGQSCESLVAG